METYISRILNQVPQSVIDYYRDHIFKDYEVNDATVNFIITEWLLQTYWLYGIFAVDTMAILHYGWHNHYLFAKAAIDNIFEIYTTKGQKYSYIPSINLSSPVNNLSVSSEE